MNKYIIEFIGTFFLVLLISFTGNPLAIGFGFAALVYMGGYVSGAHYNPAVTLAVLVTKNIKPITALVYIFVQILAGVFAASVFAIMNQAKFMPAIAPDTTMSEAIFFEALFTFLLVSVILHVAVADKVKGNNYFGLSIGLALMAGIFVAGPVSGGVLNPAVALGAILFDVTNIDIYFNKLIIYLAGPLLGGIFASVIYILIQHGAQTSQNHK